MTRLTINTSLYTNKSFIFCFYVSGHGWGHATRAIQIILDILKLPAHHKVYVISPASDFIFQGVIKQGAIYRQADIDPGVVQPLPYTVDRHQTISNLKSFLSRRTSILDQEAEWLKEVKADCVICDAPFLPCAAAAKVGIPAAISSNFTFDEVFMGLCEGDELDEEIKCMVQQTIDDYRHADLLIRLPGAIRIPSFDNAASLVPHTPFSATTFADAHKKGVANGKVHLPCTSVSNVQRQHPLPGFVRRIIDVPLVFRKYQTPREQVLEQVGIPKEIYQTHKILLLSFGGQLLANGKWGNNPLPPGWICIVCAAPDSIEMPPGFYRAAKDAYVPDLTNACDVLLGKLGYGTCSECIGHRVPFVYVSRPQFIEEHGLLKLMKDQGSAVELSRQDFESGNWADAITKASMMSGTCDDLQLRIAHNGGEVAALNLERFVIEWNCQKTVNSNLSFTPFISSDSQQIASCAST
ncbi:hypothetical protein G6F70_003648 [Rhizopus microsporus]|uniref:L-arabinokinase n=2 Tax=Rhizopus TaxID=4842 RepID=A0A367K657_RHIAZ|nr:hypothetical protein G6F71_003633 [Rhizopus microsporus]KAG1200898.1 hypothetical protein G6F70_003648 [Rhizopus microsporus]KAG1212772.1 hypothetical protein G6F69_003416 [Rhizopus microsporus]ORE12946.1 hypothetical protein BCV71DRAFT_230095 [Rhizopus microsporus]RCH97650.1 hypothetical protein CU097_014014 [Rhizopus azygosporus]